MYVRFKCFMWCILLTNPNSIKWMINFVFLLLLDDASIRQVIIDNTSINTLTIRFIPNINYFPFNLDDWFIHSHLFRWFPSSTESAFNYSTLCPQDTLLLLDQIMKRIHSNSLDHQILTHIPKLLSQLGTNQILKHDTTRATGFALQGYFIRIGFIR